VHERVEVQVESADGVESQNVVARGGDRCGKSRGGLRSAKLEIDIAKSRDRSSGVASERRSRRELRCELRASESDGECRKQSEYPE